jgi:hypothetical protein
MMDPPGPVPVPDNTAKLQIDLSSPVAGPVAAPVIDYDELGVVLSAFLQSSQGTPLADLLERLTKIQFKSIQALETISHAARSLCDDDHEGQL